MRPPVTRRATPESLAEIGPFHPRRPRDEKRRRHGVVSLPELLSLSFFLSYSPGFTFPVSCCLGWAGNPGATPPHLTPPHTHLHPPYTTQFPVLYRRGGMGGVGLTHSLTHSVS